MSYDDDSDGRGFKIDGEDESVEEPLEEGIGEEELGLGYEEDDPDNRYH